MSGPRWALAAGVLMALLLSLDVATDAAPRGIVSLELACTAERAAAILDSWEEAGLTARARLNVWLDFAFLLAYALALAWACMAASGWCHAFGSAWLAGAGLPCALAALLAGWLDAVENVGMLTMLSGGATAETAAYTMRSASVKFALVGVVFVYLALVPLAWLVAPIRLLGAGGRTPPSTPA